MKKTIIILLFSAIALTSLQIACSKSEAQTTTATTSTTQIGKVIFKGGGNSIWICNNDGTGLTQVNINLPQGFVLESTGPLISPNGQKIFFVAGQTTNNAHLYSCNVDGTGVAKIVDKASVGGFFYLGQAY
jgi:Tol biopolymer transport system component